MLEREMIEFIIILFLVLISALIVYSIYVSKLNSTNPYKLFDQYSKKYYLLSRSINNLDIGICNQCRFFENNECKRYPQIIETTPEEWCGEFVLDPLKISQKS